jgi:short-subunit dehydrogenase
MESGGEQTMMARRKIAGSRVLITGASSGIGRQIAAQLARRGAAVVVTARRADRLDHLVDQVVQHGGTAYAVAGDLNRPEVRQQALDAAVRHLGGLDALVNNAGVGAIGPFGTADPNRLRPIMELNFFVPVELTRAALPLLQQGNRPIVVNIGSVLGHRAVPGKSEYCASKFALHGFSDALRAELVPRGIGVLLVCPSTTESEFFDRAHQSQGARTAWRGRAMPASVVARKTVSAMRRGKHEIILSPGGKALVWLDRICPPLADWLVARFGQTHE